MQQIKTEDYKIKYIKYKSKYLKYKSKYLKSMGESKGEPRGEHFITDSNIILNAIYQEFVKLNYEDRCGKIEEVISSFEKANVSEPINNIHQLDQANITLFLDHIDVTQKDIYKNLIDNITYINYETFKKEFRLCLDRYIDSCEQKQCILLLAPDGRTEEKFTKSNFWLGCLAYTYLKDKGFEIFLGSVNTNHVIDLCQEAKNRWKINDVLICDDMAYSGKQLTSTCSDLNNNNNNINLHLILPYFTKLFVKRLKKLDKINFVYYDESNQIPLISDFFDIELLPDHLDGCGDNTLTYFDHKVADYMSTCEKFLCNPTIKGPILPGLGPKPFLKDIKISIIQNTNITNSHNCIDTFYKNSIRIEILASAFGIETESFYKDLEVKSYQNFITNFNYSVDFDPIFLKSEFFSKPMIQKLYDLEIINDTDIDIESFPSDFELNTQKYLGYKFFMRNRHIDKISIRMNSIDIYTTIGFLYAVTYSIDVNIYNSSHKHNKISLKYKQLDSAVYENAYILLKLNRQEYANLTDDYYFVLHFEDITYLDMYILFDMLMNDSWFKLDITQRTLNKCVIDNNSLFQDIQAIANDDHRFITIDPNSNYENTHDIVISSSVYHDMLILLGLFVCSFK